MKVLLLHLVVLAFLVLGQALDCPPNKIEYCNACQDPNIISETALKACRSGYHMIEGFCQTIKPVTRSGGRPCKRDERKTPDGHCRKRKRSFKSCPHILPPANSRPSRRPS